MAAIRSGSDGKVIFDESLWCPPVTRVDTLEYLGMKCVRDVRVLIGIVGIGQTDVVSGVHPVNFIVKFSQGFPRVQRRVSVNTGFAERIKLDLLL
eukprot:scaffold223836_cov35-Attheya_sp.AAC.2